MSKPWRKDILVGIVLIVLAFWLRYDLIRLESGQITSLRVDWMIAALYKFTGISGTFFFLLIPGLIILASGVWHEKYWKG